MKPTTVRKIMFSLGVALMILFALSSAFYLALQSDWGREKVVSVLSEAMQDSGWKAEVGEMQGGLPDVVSLKNVSLESPEGDLLTIDSLEVRLSLIHLLKKEIHFSEFYADGISWTRKERTSSAITTAAPKKSGIPFMLAFSDFRLSHVNLPKTEGAVADMEGTLKIGKYNRMAFMKLSVTRRDQPGALADVTLLVRRSKQTQLNIDLTAPSFALLSPWIEIPFEGKGDLHLFLKGPFQAFSDAVLKGKAESSIAGLIRGTVAIDKAPEGLQEALQRRWSILSAVERLPDGDVRFSNLSLKSDALLLKGNFRLDPTGELQNSSLQLTVESLRRARFAPVDGIVIAQLEMSKPDEALLNVASHHLTGVGLDVENAQGKLRAIREEGRWSGAADLTALALGKKWEGSCDLLWQSGQPFRIDDIELNSSLMNLEGHLSILPHGLIEGEIQTHIANLHDFNAFNPTWPIYGILDANLRWKNLDGAQVVEVDAKGKELFYKKMQIQQAFFYADLSGSLLSPGGHAYIEIQRANWESLSVETATIQTTAVGENWPLELRAEGEWKGPFELTGDGSCRFENRELLCTIQDLTGTLFLHPLSLASPVQFEIGAETFRTNALELNIGNASLLASIDHRGEQTDAKLLLDRFPIDFLSVNPLELSVTGTVNLDIQLSETGSKTTGSINAQVINVEIGSLGQQDPISGSALAHARLADNRLAVDIDMVVREKPLMHFTADLPVQASLYPFQAEFAPSQRALANFLFDGRIEELLDFFDLGPQRLEGDCRCELHMTNTLNRPLLEGYCRLENGHYENYVSGTELQNLQADLLAEKQSIYLRSLTAQDSQKKGKFSLHGELKALWQEHFPFEFDGEFTRLNIAEIDWMNTEAGGTVHIVGNSNSARVTGQALIVETDMTIPERVAPSLPNLQVKYINAPKPVAVEEATVPRRNPYPIFFDYHVYAPDGIFVSGRGLSSEWKGDFQLGGTYTDLEAKGRLDLLTGEFLFSGRAFKLSDGSLVFSGRPHEVPVLNIAARMNLQNLAIIARLTGPVNAPHLSFQSIPPLPLGSIMSYMLFGEDLGEINPIQAAQLVTSIATISGEGPNVMENTKRALSVDRLRIIATPVGDEGDQSYALQVGKYVTRGVLVSVSQGAEQSSTNLSVEVDLVNGFIFQIESQREQEQGKFIIKWHHNY